jgi:hypothetical protein
MSRWSARRHCSESPWIFGGCTGGGGVPEEKRASGGVQLDSRRWPARPGLGSSPSASASWF